MAQPITPGIGGQEGPVEPTDANDIERQDAATEASDADTLVEEELLVEEISIDGMCGVY